MILNNMVKLRCTDVGSKDCYTARCETITGKDSVIAWFFIFLRKKKHAPPSNMTQYMNTVKILKFGTPQTTAIIVLRIEKFDETLH